MICTFGVQAEVGVKDPMPFGLARNLHSSTVAPVAVLLRIPQPSHFGSFVRAVLRGRSYEQVDF